MKKYHYYDDVEYKEIRYVKKLFDLSVDEYYYKPIKTNDAFNSNYIEYENKGDSKSLSIKYYLNVIRPYLRDIINDHNMQTEWKIQLITIIDFISCKNSNKIHTKSNNIEIMMVMKQMKLLKNFLNLFCKYIKKD